MGGREDPGGAHTCVNNIYFTKGVGVFTKRGGVVRSVAAAMFVGGRAYVRCMQPKGSY